MKIDIKKLMDTDGVDRLPNGDYVCIINSIVDKADKECLMLHYDIYKGKYFGHFKELQDMYNNGYWAGVSYVSYKDSALLYFKKFVQAVQESNPGFEFDGENEQSLVGKLVGLTLEEKSYTKQDGNQGKRIQVSGYMPVDQVCAGKEKA